ncbi:MAG: tRNA lysidine(34) synthetase TilS [Actinomycetota bacterium]
MARTRGGLSVRVEERAYGGPGFDLVERAARSIDRYSMLADGDIVVVAVSGGPDSTCLLDVLHRLSTPRGWTLHVAHVDHGLSESSEPIAARVSSAAAAAGFEVHLMRAPNLEGSNLHARARLFRYSFFETVAREAGATKIATGHTLDDRVETTLARLVHGAGTEGLAGIPPADGGRVRPLIEVRRAATQAYCEEVELDYDVDPANEDERFERASLRTALIPTIEQRWGEGAIHAMASSAERLRIDAAALKGLADTLYDQLAKGEEGRVRFQRTELGPLPTALRRRLLERAVGRVRDRSGGIEAALDAIDAPGGETRHFDVASGVTIEISRAEVVVQLPAAQDN